jgi:hypothetical protein
VNHDSHESRIGHASLPGWGKIREKRGVNDPDLPDLPLGGWSGTVTEIIEHEGQINCDFEWDVRTLASIHPIHRQRCEVDGLDSRFMSLSQEEIEPDDGTSVPIEQPTRIVPRPLSLDDQEDRVRNVFGLTHDDLLPEVNRKNLFTYYRYLRAHLTLPLRAQYRRNTDFMRDSEAGRLLSSDTRRFDARGSTLRREQPSERRRRVRVLRPIRPAVLA